MDIQSQFRKLEFEENFLVASDSNRLQKLLINNSIFRDADISLRSAIIRNSGLSPVHNLIDLEGSPLRFIINLFSQLLKVYIEEQGFRKLALISLLEYLYEIDVNLSIEDKEFIQNVLLKWEKWEESKNTENMIFENFNNLSIDGTSRIRQNHITSSLQSDINNKRLKVYENLNRRGIPYEQFKGRDEELKKLHRFFRDENKSKTTVAITGMRGVGKTELAIQYARRSIQFYCGGICWLSARNFVSSLVEFARPRFFPDLQLKNFSLVEQSAYCWENWQTDGSVLIIIDDVVDYRQQVQQYLPESSRFKILITTRQRLSKPVVMLELDVLKTSEILELLNFFLGHERVEKEIEFAIKICEWVGHLPLGIELVGRYLALEQFSLREALERLNQERLNSNILNEVDTMMNNQSNLRSAFNLSWERLDENAQELGCILSLFALAEIPPQLLEMVSSYLVDQNATQTFDWEKRRRDLLKSSLLSRNSNGYYLHQLIREFLKEKLDSSEQNNKIKSAFTRAMISIAKQLLYDIPGRTTLENILAWSKKIPHLVEVSQNLIYFVSDENLSDCFESIGLFYDGQGLYQQAQSIYEGYLRVTQQRFGNEDIRVANAFDLLGRLHHARGNYSGAESLLKQSLDIRRFCFGNVHLTVAQSLNNLAGVYDAQRRYKEAEELLFLALEQRKQLLGNNNIDVALTMSNLAKIYESQERYEEARVLHERALYMRRELLGERHLHTVLSIHNLAQVYNLLGQYEESERLHLQALELRREILGLDHPDVAQSLNNIAGLYRNCGRDDEAETMLREALEICERRLGAEHPRILVVRENLVNPRQTRYLGLAH